MTLDLTTAIIFVIIGYFAGKAVTEEGGFKNIFGM